jgi:hypothetical protein
MPTDKDQEFVKFLLESTHSGKIQWQPTAEQNEFTTTLQLKYTVSISTRDSFRELLLADDAGQQLVAVNSINIEQLEELYELVRRQALNVDSVLDSLMRGEQITILSARYGAGAIWIDVAAHLKAKMQQGNLRVTATNEEFGSDPVPNVAKSLQVSYSVGGKPYSKTIPENQMLVLPE